jgi:hypothetical protein
MSRRIKELKEQVLAVMWFSDVIQWLERISTGPFHPETSHCIARQPFGTQKSRGRRVPHVRAIPDITDNSTLRRTFPVFELQTQSWPMFQRLQVR